MADSSGNGGSSPMGRGRGRGVRRDKAGTRPGGNDTSSSVTVQGGGSSASSTTVRSESSAKTHFSDTLVKRPGFGAAGRKVNLRTNNFVINCSGSLKLHQYQIDISHEFRQKKLKKEDSYIIFFELLKTLVTDKYSVLYDGGYICFSLIPFNLKDQNVFTVRVSLPSYDRPSDYKVSIKETIKPQFDLRDTSSMGKQSTLAVLDLVFRQWYNLPAAEDAPKKFYPFGRSFFYPTSVGDRLGFDLDAGRQVWGGYFYGVKWGANSVPIINIDVANSVFIKKQSVLQFMIDVFNQETGKPLYSMEQLKPSAPFTMSPQQLQILTKAIKGLLVTTKTVSGRAQKVLSVTTQSAEKMTFEWKQREGEPRTINVAEYFSQRYGNLRLPFLPCLEVGSKRKVAYLPLEVCEMYEPQRVAGRLTEAQTSAMIKGVCTDATEREARIRNVIQKADLDRDPFAQKFGVQISLKMMETQGRVMTAPSLEYAGSTRVSPRDGVWNMGQAKLFFSASIASYGLVSFINRNQQGELETFCKHLMSMAVQMGMRVASPFPDSVQYIRSAHEVKEAMTEIVRDCGSKGKKCEFILVAMPTKNTENYAAVKCAAEKNIGIITQVVIQRNIRQPKPQTCGNIVLKINAKLGGINWKLTADEVAKKYLVNASTLVLGIDVTHPAPTDRRAPSIGAAVGNIDTLPAKFGVSVTVQKHRHEAVVYMTDAIQKRVTEFYQQTQRKPERIIVYRDGVGETQFEQVMTTEVNNIMNACTVIGGPDYRPKITFIVVQKRHHTRFFCCNQQDMCGKGKNIPPGTVVDNTVTHPTQFDFFLCSHFGIQGTSRPAHYHVLKDDNQFSPDELQSITYYLCHMYARCTRSVSIPAPTYYAHLACARARHHLREVIGDANSDTFSDAGSGDSGTSSSEEDIKKAVDIVDSLRTKMYFV